MAGHQRSFHHRPVCEIAGRVAGQRIGQAGGTLDCLRRMWYSGDGLYVDDGSFQGDNSAWRATQRWSFIDLAQSPI